MFPALEAASEPGGDGVPMPFHFNDDHGALPIGLVTARGVDHPEPRFR